MHELQSPGHSAATAADSELTVAAADEQILLILAADRRQYTLVIRQPTADVN
jgi:hypothetical protein